MQLMKQEDSVWKQIGNVNKWEPLKKSSRNVENALKDSNHQSECFGGGSSD